MKVHRIYISPTLNSNGLARHNSQEPLYDAKYQGGVIVKGSREPGHDSARVLKAMGHTGTIEVWDEVLPYWRFRLEIDKSAELTIQEGEGRPIHRKFKSFTGHALIGRVLKEDGRDTATTSKGQPSVSTPTNPAASISVDTSFVSSDPLLHRQSEPLKK